MSRRRRNDDDSLELLLDTVCNMFGGVIFIAILLAILAGSRAVEPSPADAQPGASSAAEVLALEDAVRATESAVAASSNGSDGVAEALQQAAALAAEADSRINRLERTLAQLKDRQRDVAAISAGASDRIEELRQEARSLTELVQREQRTRSSDARLPVAKRTVKAPFHVVLRGGRIYEIYWPEGDATRDVEVRKRPEFTEVVRYATGGGYAADGSLADNPRWRETAAALDRQHRFLYIIVYPDSYAGFHHLRAVAVSCGLEYDVVLLEADRPIRLVPSNEFETQ